MAAGCAPLPWKASPSALSTKGFEVIFLSAGNGYGFLGHAAVREDDRVYSFWMVGSSFVLEEMEVHEFFKLYMQYEMREADGYTLEITAEQRRRFDAWASGVLNIDYPGREAYNVFTNNCATGVWLMLCTLLGIDENKQPMGMSTPGKLRRWIAANMKVTGQTFYPSFRHDKMRRMSEEGKSTTGEFFVPISKSDPHHYLGWRLVYTEDLRRGAFLIRPFAGAANVVTGAVQTVYGVVALPLGKTQSIFCGIWAAGMALPELLFIPFRRAGKSAPMNTRRIREILRDWNAEGISDQYGQPPEPKVPVTP